MVGYCDWWWMAAESSHKWRCSDWHATARCAFDVTRAGTLSMLSAKLPSTSSRRRSTPRAFPTNYPIDKASTANMAWILSFIILRSAVPCSFTVSLSWDSCQPPLSHAHKISMRHYLAAVWIFFFSHPPLMWPNGQSTPSKKYRPTGA